MEHKICIICKNKFEGYGNNPEPYANTGQCCDKCNMQYVIPARIAELERKSERNEY